MSSYSNSFQPARHDARALTFPLPKPHPIPSLQSRHRSAPVKSSLNILDFTDTWREEVRRSSQRLDDSIRTYGQLGLSDPVPAPQPRLPLVPSWPDSALGRDKNWPWIGENPNLSTSSVSDISSADPVRALQSPDSFSPVESQTWPSFPSWDMSAAAAQDFRLDTHAFGAPQGRFSPDSLGGPTITSTSSNGQHQRQTYEFLPKQQQGGFNSLAETSSVTPYQGSIPISNMRTTFDPFASASSMPQAPIGSGSPTKRVAADNAASDWSVTHPRTPSLKDWQHGQGGQPASSFFPSNPAAIQPATVPRNTMHDKKAAPGKPAPFNRKKELYKTEMCRNWEEKGYCFYEE